MSVTRTDQKWVVQIISRTYPTMTYFDDGGVLGGLLTSMVERAQRHDTVLEARTRAQTVLGYSDYIGVILQRVTVTSVVDPVETVELIR